MISVMKTIAQATLVVAAGSALGQPPAPAPQASAGIINPQFNAARPRAVYPVPYGPPTTEEVTKVVRRVHDYLAANSPARLIDRASGEAITDGAPVSPNATLERGVFSLIGYEMGVTYSGMLRVADATGDARYRDYTAVRLKFIAEQAPYFRAQAQANGLGSAPPIPGRSGGFNAFRSVLNPHTLDDAGSMCAVMIKAQRAGVTGNLQPLIDNYMAWISVKQPRLADGTFSRNRPLPDSLWLDDLYMSVPALAQMGLLTGEGRYFDDAVRQVTQFAARMFNREKRLWAHGWVQGMEVHPEFRWARANGWALLAMTELLDALPENHPGRAAVLELYRAHVRGLAEVQASDGRWHQLLDRPDSYLETSATAIYSYCIAHGVNRGWLDPLAHAPMAILAWHAVSTQVNAQGQVENVCVGTGMAFDPAFYYARPVSAVAPHGYGPVLLAGAEMIALAKTGKALINDEALMFGRATGM
jgi:unsaturated rhamnogalacturonyl hydrolase